MHLILSKTSFIFQYILTGSFLLLLILFLFAAPRDQLGDVNNDGSVDILDIVRIVTLIIGTGSSPTSYELWAGDVNQDEMVNILDIIIIIQYVTGVFGPCTDDETTCWDDLTSCCPIHPAHNFTWEIDILGSYFGGISFIRDAFVLAEDDIWAVGAVYLPDSTQEMGYSRYNILHWNGEEWEFILDTFPPYYYFGEKYSIFCFSDSDIWITSAFPRYFNGIEWSQPLINLDGFPSPPGIIYHSWGTDTNNMYFGESTGDIVHWNGSEFQLMETSTGSGDGGDTDVSIVDLWGIDENNIWALALNNNLLNEDNPITVLRYDGSQWNDQYVISDWQPIEGSLSGSINNLWAFGDTLYLVSGWFGIWKESISTGEAYYDDMEADSYPDDYAFGTQIRGNYYNDIYTVSWQAKYAHYNGESWYYGNEVYDYLEDSGLWYICYGLAVKDNTIIMYGKINNGEKLWLARGTRTD